MIVKDSSKIYRGPWPAQRPSLWKMAILLVHPLASACCESTMLSVTTAPTNAKAIAIPTTANS
jgi:hypothetical protein